MNQEKEQLPKTGKNILIEVGHRAYIAIPMDVFIEMDANITLIDIEGYGDEGEMHIREKPTNFKLMSDEEIDALKVKSKLIGKPNKTKKT